MRRNFRFRLKKVNDFCFSNTTKWSVFILSMEGETFISPFVNVLVVFPSFFLGF